MDRLRHNVEETATKTPKARVKFDFKTKVQTRKEAESTEKVQLKSK